MNNEAVHIVRHGVRANAQVDGAQSIRRAAQILRVVASFSGRGATLGEVVAGIAKIHAHAFELAEWSGSPNPPLEDA